MTSSLACTLPSTSSLLKLAVALAKEGAALEAFAATNATI
jgi:hypothetical protein